MKNELSSQASLYPQQSRQSNWQNTADGYLGYSCLWTACTPDLDSWLRELITAHQYQIPLKQGKQGKGLQRKMASILRAAVYLSSSLLCSLPLVFLTFS